MVTFCIQRNTQFNFNYPSFQKRILIKNMIVNPPYFPVAFAVNKLKILENK